MIARVKLIGALVAVTVGLSTTFAAHADVGLNACIGSGIPDIRDGHYACRGTDTIPRTFELGQHVHLDWQSNDGDEIVAIQIDFGPSSNTDVRNRGALFPDNGDGATMYNAQRTGNFFSAQFTDFDDSVDNFYLGFNLDRRQPAGSGGAPTDPDLTGTTISVETRLGRRFTCAFNHVDETTAYAGRALPLAGRFIRIRWLLPCQEVPIIEVNPEIMERLRNAIREVEWDFCESNSDSALCNDKDEKEAKK